MKSAFLSRVVGAVLAAIVLAAAGQAAAESLPYGSIGLYVSEDRSANAVDYTGGPTEFTMYVYCLPGAKGLSGAEFAVSYPANVIPGTVTTNPLVPVSLGSLATGISITFSECQNDWVWTHRQQVLVLSADPTRIEIEKNPASGACQFTTCEVGNPFEPALLSSSVGLNAPCPPDTTHPLILAASPISANGVQLTFSEPLLKPFAETLANYEVADFEYPTLVLSVGEARLLSDDRSVALYTWETFTTGRVYVVRVHGVYDLWGNEILPPGEQPFSPFDREPPILVKASASTDTLLTVEFNEPMTPATALNPANYTLKYSTGVICQSRPYAATFITRSSVLLHFDEPPLPILRQLVLTVKNVTDLSGNVISPVHNTAQFTVPDMSPPFVNSVVATGKRDLTVGFSEQVTSATATAAGNYVVFKKADTLSTIPVAAVTGFTNGATVNLRLGSDLLLETPYVLRASNIADINGNLMRTPSSMEFVWHDTTPPVPLTAVALLRSLIEIGFDEGLDKPSAETAANYNVYETANTSHAIYVSGAALQPSGTAVRITLGSLLSYDLSYTIRISGVKDLKGNAISQATITTSYPDSIPPSFTGVSPVAANVIDLVFDEKLAAAPAQQKSNYVLFETVHPENVIGIAQAALMGTGSTVELTLAADLVLGRGYTIAVSYLTDLKGNMIAPGTLRVFSYADSTPPRLLTARADVSTVVLATFSEKLDNVTAENPADYRVFETSAPGVTIPVAGAALQSDSSSVRLSLGSALPADVPCSLEATGVTDRAGNPVPAGSIVPITTPDRTPPHVSSVTALNRQSIRVTFDEAVTPSTAGTRANYLLAPTADPEAATSPTTVDVLDDKTATLWFATNLVPGTSYTLRVSNVTDVAGNIIAPGSEKSFVCPFFSVTRGSIGLFVDEYRSNCSVSYGGGFTPFNVYVWCLAGTDGQTAAEFHLVYPSNVIAASFTTNAIVSVYLGDITNDLSVALYQCNSGWAWLLSQDCYLTNSSPTTINVASGPIFANCNLGYPLEQANILNVLSCNGGPVFVGTLLKDFAATYLEGAVNVTWHLSQMDDGVRFTISRSENGAAGFAAVPGDITGSGLSFAYRDTGVEPGKSYRYRVEYSSGSLIRTLFETEPVAVPALPLTLNQNWPNPFNPSTTISYYLPNPVHVRLEIFDVAGRRVALLADARMESGNHSVSWKGTDESGRPMAAGIYICRLAAGDETVSRKMVLVR